MNYFLQRPRTDNHDGIVLLGTDIVEISPGEVLRDSNVVSLRVI